MGIEGLTSPKIQEIEDDLIAKEIKLKIISTSGGTYVPPAQALSTLGRNEGKR